jgi:hypothetical protein
VLPSFKLPLSSHAYWLVAVIYGDDCHFVARLNTRSGAWWYYDDQVNGSRPVADSITRGQDLVTCGNGYMMYALLYCQTRWDAAPRPFDVRSSFHAKCTFTCRVFLASFLHKAFLYSDCALHDLSRCQCLSIFILGFGVGRRMQLDLGQISDIRDKNHILTLSLTQYFWAVLGTVSSCQA